jgi:hypothetical protein
MKSDKAIAHGFVRLASSSGSFLAEIGHTTNPFSIYLYNRKSVTSKREQAPLNHPGFPNEVSIDDGSKKQNEVV